MLINFFFICDVTRNQVKKNSDFKIEGILLHTSFGFNFLINQFELLR